MNINFAEYSASERYHLMTQTVIPRPIAWALTESVIDNDSVLNLAPFSYFTAVSSDPALLMLSVGKKPTGENKDTLSNVLENKKMVIHIPCAKQATAVTQSAATLAHGESELDAINSHAPANVLTTVDFEGFQLPRLKECDIAFACDLFEVKYLDNTSQALIFVEIKHIYLNEDIASMDDKLRLKVHAERVHPLARLGANEYVGITEPFVVQRPK